MRTIAVLKKRQYGFCRQVDTCVNDPITKFRNRVNRFIDVDVQKLALLVVVPSAGVRWVGGTYTENNRF